MRYCTSSYTVRPDSSVCMWRQTVILIDTSFLKVKKLTSWCNTPPSGPEPPHYRSFTIILRLPTVGRTPLDEWSARGRDRSLTTLNAHIGRTSMPSAGLESTSPKSGRPQTHALDCAATGIGDVTVMEVNLNNHSMIKLIIIIRRVYMYSQSARSVPLSAKCSPGKLLQAVIFENHSEYARYKSQ